MCLRNNSTLPSIINKIYDLPATVVNSKQQAKIIHIMMTYNLYSSPYRNSFDSEMQIYNLVWYVL